MSSNWTLLWLGFYLGGSISKRIWPRRLPWLRQHSHSGSNHPPSQLIGFSFTFACTTSKCPKMSLLFKIAANRNYKAFWCWKQIFDIPTGRTSWKENGHSHSEDRIYQALEYTWHICGYIKRIWGYEGKYEEKYEEKHEDSTYQPLEWRVYMWIYLNNMRLWGKIWGKYE